MFLSHLPVKKSDVTPFVLLPGDPGRVDTIGEKLEQFQILGQNREYRFGKGFYKGVAVSVVSTGIGAPSTAIAVEEIIESGAQYLIRVGTCGGAWREDVPEGSLIIPTACVRDEGTTLEYIPLGFPAVASIGCVNSLQRAAALQSFPYFLGVNRTHDAFYGSQQAILHWGKYLTEERWKSYDTPILSSDMETSALFIIALLKGVNAGAVLAVNSSPESLKNRLFGKSQTVVTETSQDSTKLVVERAILTALEAFYLVSQEPFYPLQKFNE